MQKDQLLHHKEGYCEMLKFVFSQTGIQRGTEVIENLIKRAGYDKNLQTLDLVHREYKQTDKIHPHRHKKLGLKVVYSGKCWDQTFLQVSLGKIKLKKT